MRLLLVTVLWYLFVALADARIGETPIQFADRYGPPKDSSLTTVSDSQSPLIEGAIHHTYEYQGWKIRAAFLQLDGPAVRLDYQKIITAGVNSRIQDYELQAIMAANTPPGMSWKTKMYDNANSPNKGLAKFGEAYIADLIGEKMWQRTDGAIIWLRNHSIVRVELPGARAYEEQLQLAKNQKARASVPSF
jgi:hypothetical protein